VTPSAKHTSFLQTDPESLLESKLHLCGLDGRLGHAYSSVELVELKIMAKLLISQNRMLFLESFLETEVVL